MLKVGSRTVLFGQVEFCVYRGLPRDNQRDGQQQTRLKATGGNMV